MMHFGGPEWDKFVNSLMEGAGIHSSPGTVESQKNPTFAGSSMLPVDQDVAAEKFKLNLQRAYVEREEAYRQKMKKIDLWTRAVNMALGVVVWETTKGIYRWIADTKAGRK